MRECNQIARHIVIGSSVPYNYNSITTNSNTIYTGQITSCVKSVTSGVILSLHSEETYRTSVTIALSDYKGKIYKRLTKTSTLTCEVGKSNYSIPFKHKKKLHKNRVYFILVQLLNNNGVKLNVNHDGIGIDPDNSDALVYPLCKSFIGDLYNLSRFSVPSDYISNTCPCGNLY